jgi:hypothetical protein
MNNLFKFIFVFILLSGFTNFINAQKIHVNLFSGIANYKGDLQYNSRGGKQISFKQPKFAAGLGFEYEITNKIYARIALTAGKIHADDKRQPGQEQRNLNFTSSIIDGLIAGEYYILDPYTHGVVPYVFAGLSYFHYNPYTTDASGQKIFLQPLSTEGQGFVAGREPYKLSNFAIPFGGGIKFSLSDDVRIGVEISLRKTLTDYLDDVSLSYIDENVLLANRGQQAVDLSFRGDEINPLEVYPAEGTPRGTLTARDWFYFTGLTFSFRLGAGGGRSGSGKKSKLGCPTVAR